MIKRFIPLFALILCCIIIITWAVHLTLKVNLLEDKLLEFTGLMIQSIKK